MRALRGGPLASPRLGGSSQRPATAGAGATAQVDRATANPSLNVGTILLTTAVIGVVTLLMHGVRLAFAPDIYGDEGLYALVAVNLAQGRGLLDDTGTFFWHPPLYPILEALYLQAAGLAHSDFTTALLSTRWINVAFSVATACLLFLFGTRFAGTRGGLLIAALFIGDLFVQRINRRSMLESAAMFLLLAALYVFYATRSDPGRRRVAVAGALLGLAVLTKEIAAIGLVVLALHAVLFERRRLRHVAGVGAVAGLVYSVYPLWVISVGQVERFLDFKLSAVARISRFLGIVAPGPAAPPGTVLTANPALIDRLGDAVREYGPTYALLAIGAVFTAVLIIRHRHRPEAQVLICWSAVSYGVVGLGQPAALGDQFFYYVIVPAVVVIGYTLTLWLRGAAAAGEAGRARELGQPDDRASPDRMGVAPSRRPGRVAVLLLAGLLVALFTYDAAVWAGRYALGRDDSYARITTYVSQHIPSGTTIVAGADVSNFLLRPTYDIQFLRTERTVRTAGARYFLLSSKEAALGYNRMTPAFYDWVRANTRPLIELEGPTFWTLGLYEWTGGSG